MEAAVIDANVPAQPNVLKKIAVVDDQLFSLKRKDLAGSDIDFFEDRTSEELAELWGIIQKQKPFNSLEDTSDDEIQAFLNTDDFIEDVLLSEVFDGEASQNLKQKFDHFFMLSTTAKKHKEIIKKVFPTSEFEVEYLGVRPQNPKVLLNYEFIMLDLFMNDSVTTIQDLKDYLKKLATSARTSPIPPIVLFSSNPSLSENRKSFSKAAKISSAGIYILLKADLLDTNFADVGLALIYKQLTAQIDVANKMRNFIKAWVSALNNAKSRAEENLWNLDAGAMQYIHYTAVTDNDPYDEHLSELISREYSWHVESNPKVRSTLSKLDNSLFDHLESVDGNKQIKNHFVVPMEQKDSRNLISHFTWSGLTLPEAFNNFPENKTLISINKLIPFGALLIDKNFAEAEKKVALIHITQQCDLNDISRGDFDKSLTFVIAEANKVENHKISQYNSQDLVAKSLKINDIEYDFQFIKGRLLCLPVRQFLQYSKEHEYKVMGRLRHDIASLFMQATVNEMLRPASQKLDRSVVIKGKIYLRIPNSNEPILFVEQGVEKVFQLYKIKSNSYSFYDSDSNDIGMWLKVQGNQYNSDLFKDLDVYGLSQALMKPRKNGAIVPNIEFKVMPENLNEATAKARGVATRQNTIIFILIIEPES